MACKSHLSTLENDQGNNPTSDSADARRSEKKTTHIPQRKASANRGDPGDAHSAHTARTIVAHAID